MVTYQQPQPDIIVHLSAQSLAQNHGMPWYKMTWQKLLNGVCWVDLTLPRVNPSVPRENNPKLEKLYQGVRPGYGYSRLTPPL